MDWKGTGLGLSICYDIIKNHSGNIVVDSQLGKGAVSTVILPDTVTAGSLRVALHIMQAIRTKKWLYADALPCKTITMSIGVVSYPKEALLKEELISKADEAMYQAKKTGKNKVCYYDKNKIVDYNEE